MEIIQARKITKQFGDLQVLKNINISVKKGEVISIVGKSGAGKTTLLQILGTLDRQSEGILKINNISTSSLSDKELSSFRNQNIGFIFQFHQLLPEFTALENVILPGLIGKKNKQELERKASELMLFLGLNGRENHKPTALSGGEQQRVSVARALINNPQIVLADEPSGNLDSQSANDLHKLFFKLRDELNQTFIIVTHNENLANMADRKLTISDGVILE